jgi:short subunit dehydrogenase-like uncharacterized protein
MVAGRNPSKLHYLKATLPADTEFRVATPSDPSTLDGLFEGVDVVINTVGPFGDLGEPVVRAAIEQGVHYLDTTGEQAYMKRIMDRYDEAAKDASLAVICAQAFEYALGDCAASLVLAELGGGGDSVDVFYKVENPVVSRGTAKSIFRVASDKVGLWQNGAFVRESFGKRQKKVLFPGEEKKRTGVAIPAGEALHIPRHHDVAAACTYMTLPDKVARKLCWGRYFLPLTKLGLVRKIADRRISQRPEGPSAEQRADAHFKVLARARKGERSLDCLIKAHDPYGITATIAVAGAKALLQAPPRQCGVISTSMAFDPREFLDGLKDSFVSWHFVEETGA